VAKRIAGCISLVSMRGQTGRPLSGNKGKKLVWWDSKMDTVIDVAGLFKENLELRT